MTKTEWRHEPATINTDAAWFLSETGYYVTAFAPGRFSVSFTDGKTFVTVCEAGTLASAKKLAEVARTAGITGIEA